MLEMIKKGITGKNRIRKFTFFAVGEILLIVLGVLLAVNVDEWLEAKHEKKMKIEILNSLKENLKKDKTKLMQIMAFDSLRHEGVHLLLDTLEGRPMHYNADKMNSYVKRSNYPEEKYFKDKIQALEILRDLYIPADMSIYSHDAVYQTLAKGNNLLLIKNLELQTDISSYYSLVKYINRSEDHVREFRTNPFALYLMQNSKLGEDLDFFLKQKSDYIGFVRKLDRVIAFQLDLYLKLYTKLIALEEKIEKELQK